MFALASFSSSICPKFLICKFQQYIYQDIVQLIIFFSPASDLFKDNTWMRYLKAFGSFND